MKVRALDKAPELKGTSPAKVTSMGNVTLITSFEKGLRPPQIKKLSKDEFLVLDTGEVKEFKHAETRAENMGGIRRTLALIRALINTNVTVPANCRWVTLTYAENMTDTGQLYRDYEAFWKRFCRWCKKEGHGKPEYLAVIEPQGRGAWHVHAFFIWEAEAPYIPNNDVLEKLWGHGFTSCKRVNDCDNIGAYFSAYLADMPLDELEKLPEDQRTLALQTCEVQEKEFLDGQEQRQKKKFVKGARLILYPAGMNIVRRSKGIRDPEVEWMTLERAKEKVSSHKLTFSEAYEVVDDDCQSCNTLCKEYYNSKRK